MDSEKGPVPRLLKAATLTIGLFWRRRLCNRIMVFVAHGSSIEYILLLLPLLDVTKICKRKIKQIMLYKHMYNVYMSRIVKNKMFGQIILAGWWLLSEKKDKLLVPNAGRPGTKYV